MGLAASALPCQMRIAFPTGCALPMNWVGAGSRLVASFSARSPAQAPSSVRAAGRGRGVWSCRCRRVAIVQREIELVDPVDLCSADGRRLNPAAKGWSRTPLHRANLLGRWGRNKRWDYWAVLTDTHAVSVTYADVDYLGIVDFWWCELATGQTGGVSKTIPGARGIALPDIPGEGTLSWTSADLKLALTPSGGGGHGSCDTTLSASWTDSNGSAASIDLMVRNPAGHESLNVVIPWSDKRFQFTSKHQARPVEGTMTLGGVRIDVGDAHPGWGVLDVGRGRWPYSTIWNWGGGAGLAADGSTVVGIQIGGKWTEGTGHTENGMIVNGRLHKISDELVWNYSWERPLDPWTVESPDGSLQLVLSPTYDKHSRTELGVLGTQTHQVFGRWSGRFGPPGEDPIEFDGLVGFAEESRSRW